MQGHHPIRERHQHLHVVLDEDDGHAFAPQLFDELDEAGDGALVDAAGHLVEQQQARPGAHGPGELQALALPGAQAVGVDAPLVEQADEVQRRECRVPRPPQVRIVLHDAHHHVLLDRHVGEGLELLERAGDAEAVDAVGPQAPERPAFEPHVALVRRLEAGDQLEQRGLAGPVRPDDPEDLAGLGPERDPVVGDQAAEAPGQVRDLKHRRSARRAGAAGRGARPDRTPRSAGSARRRSSGPRPRRSPRTTPGWPPRAGTARRRR